MNIYISVYFYTGVIEDRKTTASKRYTAEVWVGVCPCTCMCVCVCVGADATRGCVRARVSTFCEQLPRNAASPCRRARR